MFSITLKMCQSLLLHMTKSLHCILQKNLILAVGAGVEASCRSLNVFLVSWGKQVGGIFISVKLFHWRTHTNTFRKLKFQNLLFSCLKNWKLFPLNTWNPTIPRQCTAHTLCIALYKTVSEVVVWRIVTWSSNSVEVCPPGCLKVIVLIKLGAVLSDWVNFH